MANWHEKNCRRPDVVLVDIMPTCMSCGSFYNRDGNDEAANFGELQRAVSEFEETPAHLNLNWPSTVDFSNLNEIQDTSIRETSKQLANMLEEQHRYLHDQRPKSPIGTSSKSPVSCSHEELSSAVEDERGFDPGAIEPGRKENPEDRSSRTESLVYSPLREVDAIRLLRLSRGVSTDDQVLHGFLENTTLSIRPEYTALSYTWADADGNRDLSEVIFLGDLWIPLPITRNCAAALRRLRSRHQDQILWVDSICMNQSSKDEKSHQVGLMRDIFSRATSVRLFLGGDEDTPEARLLQRTSENLFYKGNQGDIIWAALHDHVAVRALFDRPYWSRIWVIQEILLSKVVLLVLGQTAIPLQSLLQARLVEPHGPDREFGVPPWLRLRKELPIQDFHGLSKLLTETSNCRATDPKDMVFALLGLVQGASLEGLVADYSKSISEIRVGIAAYFLIRHKQISILKSAAHDASIRQGDRLLPGSPSWVPTWNPHPANEPTFADSVDGQWLVDLRQGSIFGKWDRMMRCYDTLRPGETSNVSLGYSWGNACPFRVLNGTGALLAKLRPLLRIDLTPFRGAFKYRDIARRSVLFTPSASAVRWGIYATRKWSDEPSVFSLPGDWIVEIPGCDDFALLRQIPSLPGVYRIASVCGLAIAVAWIDGWLPGSGLAPPANGSKLPRYKNDELISRLVLFDQQQLHFLETWKLLAPCGTTHGPSSEKPGPAMEELSLSLSAEDVTRYILWTDRINSDPLVSMQPTDLKDTLRNVATYLDRWQDLELWDRIVSELEAVPWHALLHTLYEVRWGLRFDQASEGQTANIPHDKLWPTGESLLNMMLKLRDLLLELTRRGIPLRPASSMDPFGPMFEALDKADTSKILEVFKEREKEIERHLKGLESHLDFMRDSLPICYVIREKFSQRQVLKQLYERGELREFLIY